MKKLDAIKSLETMQLPPALKGMAAIALGLMDQKTLDTVFGGASEALEKLKAGDRTAAENALEKIGLPSAFVKELLDKVSAGNESKDQRG
jgi:hypothetical protein